MRPSRWQDVIVVVAVIALAAAGVCALWWDDLRGWMGGDGDRGAPPPAASVAPGTAS